MGNLQSLGRSSSLRVCGEGFPPYELRYIVRRVARHAMRSVLSQKIVPTYHIHTLLVIFCRFGHQDRCVAHCKDCIRYNDHQNMAAIYSKW